MGPYSGITSLHLAAANGHIAVVEALIAFDAVMSGGATRLHVATQNNYIDAARFDGLTSITYSCSEWLSRSGVKVNPIWSNSKCCNG